jgi:hypothetical protein
MKKLNIKNVTRNLLQNDEVNISAFVKRQLAEQLVRCSMRLPPALKNWIVKKIIPGHRGSSALVDEPQTASYLPHLVEAKPTRRHYTRHPKETSNWWIQFLSETQRMVLQNDPKHRDSLMFKTLFRVNLPTFVLLQDLILDNRWYNPEATDTYGIRCHNVELLLLGCLHVLGHSATQKVCKSNTQMSSETHRVYAWVWHHRLSRKTFEILYSFVKYHHS